MAIVVLDASVVIALLDASDAHHAAAVAAIGQARREALVLPASAYAAVLVDPSRRGPEAALDATVLTSDRARTRVTRRARVI